MFHSYSFFKVLSSQVRMKIFQDRLIFKRDYNIKLDRNRKHDCKISWKLLVLIKFVLANLTN